MLMLFAYNDYDNVYALVDWRRIFFHFIFNRILHRTAQNKCSWQEMKKRFVVSLSMCIDRLTTNLFFSFLVNCIYFLLFCEDYDCHYALRVYSNNEAVSRIYSRQRNVGPYWCNPAFSSPSFFSPANSSHPCRCWYHSSRHKL